MKEMEPLIERAKKEGKWLWCRYQDLWFSPGELEKNMAEGRFRWGPVNWELRDPLEKIRNIENEIEGKKQTLEELKQRMLRKE